MSLPPPPPAAAPVVVPPPLPSVSHVHMGSFAGGLGGRPPTQVLLVNVPEVLHSSRSMRAFLQPVTGSVRSILFVPPSSGPNDVVKKIEGHTITALLTLPHSEAALRVVAVLKQFAKDVADEIAFQAHLVPTNPGIPLPPAMMDQNSVEILVAKLKESFESVKKGETVSTEVSVVPSEQPESVSNQDQDIDDEEADPLKAPEVLRHVQEFRAKLEQQQGTKAVRRKEMVMQKLERMLPEVRQRMKEESERAPGMHGSGILPPPPFAPGNLPLPGAGALPPPPPGAPRAVSNLPAWMTKQMNEESNTSTNTGSSEPPSKRFKPDDSFPFIPVPSHATLRDFIASQIRNFLGEEEATLIDFIFHHVTSQKTVEGLLPELKDVLDEDANACLQAVFEKSHELAAQQ